MRITTILLATLLVATTAAPAQRLGTSRADLGSYSGAFSIENASGTTLSYQVKWGESSPWRLITLNNGQVETHTYPLGSNPQGRAPIPFVRYDRIGGDGRFTPQEYRMEFTSVGYAGYGPNVNRNQPKPYVFQFAPDRRTLDLRAR